MKRRFFDIGVSVNDKLSWRKWLDNLNLMLDDIVKALPAAAAPTILSGPSVEYTEILGLSDVAMYVAQGNSLFTFTGTAFEDISTDYQLMWNGSIILDGSKHDSITLQLVTITNGHGTFKAIREVSRSIYG